MKTIQICNLLGIVQVCFGEFLHWLILFKVWQMWADINGPELAHLQRATVTYNSGDDHEHFGCQTWSRVGQSAVWYHHQHRQPNMSRVRQTLACVARTKPLNNQNMLYLLYCFLFLKSAYVKLFIRHI